jgi:hypothetical protein
MIPSLRSFLPIGFKLILALIYMSAFLGVSKLSAVDQLVCEAKGCYIEEQAKMILPLWTFKETLEWYRSIQKYSIPEEFDRISSELVKVRTVLAKNIDPRVRQELLRSEKYLSLMLDTRLKYIGRIQFPEPAFDSSSKYDFTLQKYPLSCEMNAASTMIQPLGIDIEEDDLIRKMKFLGNSTLE